MKSWNWIGYVKTIFFCLLGIHNLVRTGNTKSEPFLYSPIFLLLFGIILVPILTRIFKIIRQNPIENIHWNDSPIKSPLNMFHFFSFFFMVPSVGSIIGGLAKNKELDTTGIMILFLGVGLWLGVHLTLKIRKTA